MINHCNDIKFSNVMIRDHFNPCCYNGLRCKSKFGVNDALKEWLLNSSNFPQRIR